MPKLTLGTDASASPTARPAARVIDVPALKMTALAESLQTVCSSTRTHARVHVSFGSTFRESRTFSELSPDTLALVPKLARTR